MDFPFQSSNERLSEKLIQQLNLQKAEIDRLSSRLKTLEERYGLLHEYILSEKRHKYRDVVLALYKFRVVDIYRSFFSREYFMGSVQQALGYWHQAQVSEIDEKVINKFVVIYLTRLVNDLSIAKGNIAYFTQSVGEKVETEERLAFTKDKTSDFDSIDKMIEAKCNTLEHEKTDKNNVLYVRLWQQIEPLFLPFEDVDLVSDAKNMLFSPDNISILMNTIERIFMDNGILICYVPSELPPDMMRPNYFEEVDSISEQKPLIVRKEDNYMYTKGYVVNIDS